MTSELERYFRKKERLSRINSAIIELHNTLDKCIKYYKIASIPYIGGYLLAAEMAMDSANILHKNNHARS